MAVIFDLGESKDIHPKNKQDVGKRLALWALGTTYGQKLTYCGPLPKSITRQGDKMVVALDYVGGGLVAKGEKLDGFAVAGARVVRPHGRRLARRLLGRHANLSPIEPQLGRRGVRPDAVGQRALIQILQELAANRETAEVTGIPFMTDAQHQRAMAILQAE